MSKNKPSLLKNERGSILVVVIAALAITTGFLAFYFTEQYAIQKLDKSRVVVGSTIKTYMASVHSYLISQRSLLKTLKSPLNGDLWRCANDPNFDCPQTAPTALTVISELGDDTNPFSNPAPSAGLDLNMAPCMTYPSLNCPFRYEMTWYADCVPVAGACYAPDLYAAGKLVIATSVEGVLSLNTANYNLLVKIK